MSFVARDPEESSRPLGAEVNERTKVRNPAPTVYAAASHGRTSRYTPYRRSHRPGLPGSRCLHDMTWRPAGATDLEAPVLPRGYEMDKQAAKIPRQGPSQAKGANRGEPRAFANLPLAGSLGVRARTHLWIPLFVVVVATLIRLQVQREGRRPQRWERKPARPPPPKSDFRLLGTKQTVQTDFAPARRRLDIAFGNHTLDSTAANIDLRCTSSPFGCASQGSLRWVFVWAFHRQLACFFRLAMCAILFISQDSEVSSGPLYLVSVAGVEIAAGFYFFLCWRCAFPFHRAI
ncbi:hypothetical protein CPLU01_10941 [Colletotrichum plurivorum]|uniref:Transmembrane protein n=1 Tax=Colletotrichum plurivorum TaxID=2175906 RepID=A0A8H6K4E0_9PEZI|nr:hypothetical protein CPLU01_10941 [Colletotrichum plurivorum]